MKFVCENCKAKYQIGDEKVAGKTLRMKCRRCGHMIQVSSSVTEGSVSRGNPGLREPTGELTGAELLLTGVHSAVSMPGTEGSVAGLAPTAPAASGSPSPPRAAERPQRPDLSVKTPQDDDSATVVRPSPLFLRTTGAGMPAAGAPRPSVGASSPPGALSSPGAVPRAPSAPRIVPPARASVRPGGLTGGIGASSPAGVRASTPPAARTSVAPTSLGGSSGLAVGFTQAVSQPPPAAAPSDSQTEDWYVGVGGVPLGPVRVSVIREKAAAGSVDGDSLVWREGFDEWQPLKLFPTLLAIVDDARKKTGGAPVVGGMPQRSVSSTQIPAQVPPPSGVASIAALLDAPKTDGAKLDAPKNGHTNGSINVTAPAPVSLGATDLGALNGKDEPKPLADPFRPSVAPVAVMTDPFAAPARPIEAPKPAFAATAPIADRPSGALGDNGGLGAAVLSPSLDSLAPKPAKKGIHPMAWAFVAMCAAFGGVAAWAVFFRKSQPEIVYQNTTTTVTIREPGAPPPGGPAVNGGDPEHTSETPQPNESATPGSPNGVQNGGLHGVPSSAKTAKPGDTSAPLEPDNFDTGQVPGPKATSTAGTDTGKGTLSAGEIEGVVNRNKPGISRRCWDPAFDASDGKTKSAKVSANLTIGPSGSVSSVTASGGSGFPTLAGCVQSSIAGWHFPPADGESHANIPFSFSKQ